MGASVRLQRVGGKLVSSRSKTGDSRCSAAMSAKQNARYGNPIGMALELANKILGECRAKGHALKQSAAHASAGNVARSQHLQHRAMSGGPVGAKARTERARELVAQRHTKSAPARAAAPARAQSPVVKAKTVRAKTAPKVIAKSIPAKPQPKQAPGRGTDTRAALATAAKALRARQGHTAATREQARGTIRALQGPRPLDTRAKVAAAPPKPTPLAQAAAHRATKGTREQRLFRVEARATIAKGKLGDRMTAEQPLKSYYNARENKRRDAVQVQLGERRAVLDRRRGKLATALGRKESTPAKATPAPKSAAPAVKPSPRPAATSAKAAPGRGTPERIQKARDIVASRKPGSTEARIAHAFETTDKGHNFTSLHHIRAKLPDVPKEQFDKAINNLRRSRQYTLDTHEGLHGEFTPEMRAGAIHEAGSRYIWMSRNQAKRRRARA